MAVNLSKPISASMATTSGAPNSALSPSTGSDIFRKHFSTKVFDDYCDDRNYADLLLFGIQSCQLDRKTTEILISMELESNGITNERALLLELNDLLHRFTDSDKKLDPKEQNDAIQFVCKTRVGFSKGLNYDVANHYILDFCRTHRVKLKVGFMKWQIPY
jgi:hypothetical protein